PVLRPALKNFFSDFVRDPAAMPSECEFDKTLSVQIAPSSLKFATCFVMGGHTDEQAGGWVVSEVIRNLEICIADKTKKVTGYKDKYAEWWLILVDHIAYGLLDANDIADVRQLVPKPQPWTKIVIINPMQHARWYEL